MGRQLKLSAYRLSGWIDSIHPDFYCCKQAITPLDSQTQELEILSVSLLKRNDCGHPMSASFF
jgi:hypothetical protein